MSQPRPQSPANIPDDTLRKIVDVQVQKGKNEAAEIQLKERELTENTKLAMKAMEYQYEDNKRAPNENRKSITRLAWIVGLFLLVIMAFILICLWLNKDEFIMKLIQYSGYVASTAFGYWIRGKADKKKDSDKEPPIQEV